MPPLQVIIRPVAGECNLRCSYCTYDDAGCRDIPPGGIMSPEILETVVRRALSEATGRCTFVFQGREPLLAGLDFYTELIRLERKYNTGRLQIGHLLMTNGVLMTSKWARFLTTHRFRVIVSLDGPKALHNSNRPDGKGKGSFGKASTAAQILKNHGGEVQVQAVVTPATLKDLKKVYRTLREPGDVVQRYLPCQSTNSGPGGERLALTAEEYGAFLIGLYDLWQRDRRTSHPARVELLDSCYMTLQGIPPQTCAMQGHCAENFTVAADGSVYPCEYYIHPRWYLGNILEHSFEELSRRERELGFVESSKAADPKCEACRWQTLCRGGCRKDRQADPAAPLGLNRYCEGIDAFFTRVIPNLAQLAGVENPAGETVTSK